MKIIVHLTYSHVPGSKVKHFSGHGISLEEKYVYVQYYKIRRTWIHI